MDTNMDGGSIKCKILTERKKKLEYYKNEFLQENSEDLYNDIFTSRVTNLENALHSAKDELRTESQMRVKRETILDRLQEQLKAKVINKFPINKNSFFFLFFFKRKMN